MSEPGARGAANWLEALARGAEVKPELSFIEPDLRWELHERRGGEVVLRTYFELESRPRWATASVAPMSDLWTELECSADDLQEAAHILRYDLARFPVREESSDSACP